MDDYDSAQIAVLKGIYILDTLGWITELKKVGLYQDDGLTFIPDSNGSQISKLQKKIIRVFNWLKIVIQYHLKIVNFLDITFHLFNNIFKSLIKDNHLYYCQLQPPQLNSQTSTECR